MGEARRSRQKSALIDIANVFDYMSSFEGLAAKQNVQRVIRLSAVIISPPHVDVSLSGAQCPH